MFCIWLFAREHFLFHFCSTCIGKLDDLHRLHRITIICLDACVQCWLQLQGCLTFCTPLWNLFYFKSLCVSGRMWYACTDLIVCSCPNTKWLTDGLHWKLRPRVPSCILLTNSHNPPLVCFTQFLLTFSSVTLLTSILPHFQCSWSAHLALSKTRPLRKFTASSLFSLFMRINSTRTPPPPELPRIFTYIHLLPHLPSPCFPPWELGPAWD